MQFRRVWTSEEACTRADCEEDTLDGRLGSKSLRLLAQSSADTKQEVYHVGDVKYDGDIRNLIGVIKWYPQSYQDISALPRGYFREYPRADSIRVGQHFSQLTNC